MGRRRGGLGAGIIGAGVLLNAASSLPKRAHHPWMIPLFRLSAWSFVAAIVAFFGFTIVSAIEPHFGLPVLYVMVWCAILSFFFLWGALIAALSPPQ